MIFVIGAICGALCTTSSCGVSFFKTIAKSQQIAKTQTFVTNYEMDKRIPHPNGTAFDKAWFPPIDDSNETWAGFVDTYLRKQWTNGHSMIDAAITHAEANLKAKMEAGEKCDHVDEDGHYTVVRDDRCVFCYHNEVMKMIREIVKWSVKYWQPLLGDDQAADSVKNLAIKELRAENFSLKELIRDKNAKIAELGNRVKIVRDAEQLTESEIAYYKKKHGDKDPFASLIVKHDAVCVTLRGFLTVNRQLTERRNELEARVRSLTSRCAELEKAYNNTVTNTAVGPLVNVLNNLCLGVETLSMQNATLIPKAIKDGKVSPVLIQSLDRGCVVDRYMADPWQKEATKIVRTEQFYQGGSGSDPHMIIHGSFDTPPFDETDDNEWVSYAREIIPSDDSLGGFRDIMRRSSQRDVRGTGNVAHNAKRRRQEQRALERHDREAVDREALDQALHRVGDKHGLDLMRLASYKLPSSVDQGNATEGNATPLGARRKKFTMAACQAAGLPLRQNLSYRPPREAYGIDPSLFEGIDRTGEAALASVTRVMKKRYPMPPAEREEPNFAVVNEYLDQTNNRVDKDRRLAPMPPLPPGPAPPLPPGPPPQRRMSVSDAESELHEARGGALDSLVDMDQDGDDAQEGAN